MSSGGGDDFRRRKRRPRRAQFESLETRLALTYALTQTLLPDPTGPQNASAGAAVAVGADYFVVGSPSEAYESPYNAGDARVYSASSKSLLLTLTSPNPEVSGRFGESLAISGNLIAVGAPGFKDGSVSGAGRAFVFSAVDGHLVSTLVIPSPVDSNQFGASIAIDGMTVVVGTALSTGSVYIYDALTGVRSRTIPPPAPTSTTREFGAAVAVKGDAVIIGAPAESTNRGSAYIYSASTGAQVRTLINPTPAANDNFGDSLAVSGSTVVVAASGDTSNAGAAYTYALDTGVLMATLVAPVRTSLDRFGVSTAIFGASVVVGAVQSAGSGSTSGPHGFGKAFVFDAATGALQLQIDNPEPGADDLFGSAVGVNADSVLVGASGDNIQRMESGAGWWYDRTTSGAAQLLANPSRPRLSDFGNCVAMSEDWLVVNAPLDNIDASWAGRVYVYNTHTGALVSTLTRPGGAQANAWFGARVDISGNLIIVSSYFDSAQSFFNGRAYVFDAPTGQLVGILSNPNMIGTDSFSVDVAISGGSALVGAHYADDGLADSGIAYVMNATTGAVTAVLHNPTPVAGEHFGAEVELEGNLAAVYVPTASQNSAGEVHLFDATTGAFLRTLVNPAPGAQDSFGSSLAILGHYVAVGAPGADVGGTDRGAAYLFDADTGALVRTFTAPGLAAGDHFGYSVGLTANAFFASAPSRVVDGVRAGQAFVFDLATGALQDAIPNPAPGAGDFFGDRLTALGDILVVGASSDDTQNKDQGAAYVYLKPPARLAVSDFTPTASGARFTFNQPAELDDLNLYAAGQPDFVLQNAAGETINGSLIARAGNTTFEFVATNGALSAGQYTLRLRSAADGFHTPDDTQLDGDGDQVAGGDFVRTFTAAPAPGAVVVSVPNFARGPGQAVHVPADATAGLPIQVSDGGGLTALSFELQFDDGLLSFTGVTLVGGGTANLTPVSPGRVQVALTFATPLANGPQTVAYLSAAVPTSAASRYGEREVLDISALSLTAGGGVPGIDRDAVHVNAYFGDAGRNGNYDSFDVQQASRMSLRLDSGFQQHPLLDPTILADFNSNGRIDSFDVQRLSRLALRLPVSEAPALPIPLPTTTDTDRLTAEEPPKSKSEKSVRSDVDGNGAVDAQDVAWAIYYFNRSTSDATVIAERRRLDSNGDGFFDAADVLLTITDFNAVTHEAAVESDDASARTETEDDLAYLLAGDLLAAARKKRA